MNWFLSLLTTDSTGTLRRSETSVNPKKLANWRAFSFYSPSTKQASPKTQFERDSASIPQKRTFTRPNSQKRTRNVFTRLNNYSRTRSADGFDGSTARTSQNGKLSHQKTVNGTRNFSRTVRRGGFGARPRFRFVEPHRVTKGVPFGTSDGAKRPRLCTPLIVPVVCDSCKRRNTARSSYCAV